MKRRTKVVRIAQINGSNQMTGENLRSIAGRVVLAADCPRIVTILLRNDRNQPFQAKFITSSVIF